MPDIVFDKEWVVEAGLTQAMGLSKSQIKEYRRYLWVEGVHFKHFTVQGQTDNPKGTLWYNYPKINQLVREA